jgi:hypothetical protein
MLQPAGEMHGDTRRITRVLGVPGHALVDGAGVAGSAGRGARGSETFVVHGERGPHLGGMPLPLPRRAFTSVNKKVTVPDGRLAISAVSF